MLITFFRPEGYGLLRRVQPRPQGFSLKKFLREKPWGRGCAESVPVVVTHSKSVYNMRASEPASQRVMRVNIRAMRAMRVNIK